MNAYVTIILEILDAEISNVIKDLLYNKDELNNLDISFKFTKSEHKIYSLLCEATIFLNYGVSSEEILKETGVSKRTLIYFVKQIKGLFNTYRN